MKQFTERIALEQFNYVEVSGDSFQEMLEAGDEVRNNYNQRLHIEQVSTKSPFPSDQGIPTGNVYCDTCQSPMKLEQKKSKKSGKMYWGYFCPNSTPSVPHGIKFPER